MDRRLKALERHHMKHGSPSLSENAPLVQAPPPFPPSNNQKHHTTTPYLQTTKFITSYRQLYASTLLPSLSKGETSSTIPTSCFRRLSCINDLGIPVIGVKWRLCSKGFFFLPHPSEQRGERGVLAASNGGGQSQMLRRKQNFTQFFLYAILLEKKKKKRTDYRSSVEIIQD